MDWLRVPAEAYRTCAECGCPVGPGPRAMARREGGAAVWHMFWGFRLVTLGHFGSAAGSFESATHWADVALETAGEPKKT